MSLLNQPSRLMISADDLEWGSGNNFNITLPEAITSAQGVDCARAVIPNTQYPIPTYQSQFIYEVNGVQQSLRATVARNYTSITELVTQLNADAVAQSQSLSFSYDESTTRVSVVIAPGAANVVRVQAGINDQLVVGADAAAVPYQVLTIPAGSYSLSQFASVLQSTIQPFITANNNAVGQFATLQVTVPSNNTLLFTLNAYNNYPPTAFNFTGSNIPVPLPTNETARAGFAALIGETYNQQNGTYFQGSASTSTLQPPNPVVTTPTSVRVSPRSVYPGGPEDKLRFALNTRLGFPYAGLTGIAGQTLTGTFMPNILRTKVIYILCNISVNDSISTDGLRNVLAKVPVDSVYGGTTIFAPAELVYNRIVPQTYQNIQVQLLDDNYQPYQLQVEEPTEIELVFKYAE